MENRKRREWELGKNILKRKKKEREINNNNR